MYVRDAVFVAYKIMIPVNKIHAVKITCTYPTCTCMSIQPIYLLYMSFTLSSRESMCLPSAEIEADFVYYV